MDYDLVKAFIDLNAIQKNIINLKQITNKKSEFMAVVKADAYGHGAVKTAECAVKNKVKWLGTARLNEAVKLRKANIKANILNFGYIHPVQVHIANKLDIILSIYDLEMAEQLSFESKKLSKPIKVHLKIDTGMGRIGMIAGNKKTIQNIIKILKLPRINVKGIYTHFASADHKDKTYAKMQLNTFISLLNDLKKHSIEFEKKHVANSAAIIDMPESHFDMVRAGIALYGLYPSIHTDRSKIKLYPAMTLKSIITSVKEVPKGFKVSYGMTYETFKKTKLASVPIGYADGFSRLFSSDANKPAAFVLVNQVKAFIVGRVCMDQIMVDIGHIPNVKIGDEVVLIGCKKNNCISADDLAKRINTINYEVVSSLTNRVKKIYDKQ